MDRPSIITVEPGKRSGRACIRGLRITVDDVLHMLGSSMSEAEILTDFPELTPADIRASLAFADGNRSDADRMEEMSTDAALRRRRFTVEEFLRMGEASLFAPDERVELIDGEVLEMAAVGADHVASVFALEDFFRSVVGPEIRVVMQNALQTPSGLPWPDAALLVRERLDPAKLPGADACILAVEVADSTRLLDRNRKRLSYARAGIPEYWVVDLRTDAVVQHLKPSSGDYADVQEYGRDRVFVSPALGGREVRVSDLLGHAPGSGVEE